MKEPSSTNNIIVMSEIHHPATAQWENEAEEMASYSHQMEKHNQGRKWRIDHVKTLSREDFMKFFIYREQQYLNTAHHEERLEDLLGKVEGQRDRLLKKTRAQKKEIDQLKTAGRHIMKKTSEWEAKNEDVKREYTEILEKAKNDLKWKAMDIEDLKKKISFLQEENESLNHQIRD